MERDWRVTVTVLVISLLLNVVLFSSGAFSNFAPSITTQAVTNGEPTIDVYTKQSCVGEAPYQECEDTVYVQCNGFEEKIGTVEDGSVKLDS